MTSSEFIDILQSNEDTNSNDLLRISVIQTQIENILQSYTDFSDTFAEIIQNSFDSLLTKIDQTNDEYTPKLNIILDENDKSVIVMDNGVGISNEDFKKIFRPNFSLKKFKKYPHSRGHKGAATTYLQFAHSYYSINSKHDDQCSFLSLTDGDKWVKDLSEYLNDSQNKSLPNANFVLDNSNHPFLDNHNSGCVVKIKFSKSDHISLFNAIFENKDTTIKKLEHILLTRTALGYISTESSDLSLPDNVQKIKTKLEVKFSDSTGDSSKPTIGHFYPHILAKERSKTVSQFSKQSRNSELIWKCWTHDNLKEAFFQADGPFKNETDLLEIFRKFKISGYTSYAFENELYEKMIQTSLGLEPNNRNALGTILYEYIIGNCTNAKWKMAAVDYPNGSLNAFEHRGGSEARSRFYCIWNFDEPFKPDYGRKSYPAEVKPFIIKATKALMLKMQDETSSNLKRNSTAAPRGALNGAEAQQRQNELRDKIKNDRQGSGPYLKGVDINFAPSVATELEVQDYFLHLIRSGKLKGYEVLQINNNGINDLLFNFTSQNTDEFIWHDTENPLGIQVQGPGSRLTDRWIEFKVSITNLFQELDYAPDKDSKKWWGLIDLVVVSSLDGATGDRGYQIKKIDSTNINERIFYGATHYITSNNDSTVINLFDLSEF